MANLTLSIDEEILRRARMRALSRGTSVNAVLREFLEAYAGGTDERQRAVAEVLALAKRARSGRGAARWTRDELHD